MIQSITFRLSDSLPATVLTQWRQELDQAVGSEKIRSMLLERRAQEYLDAGRGSCWLRQPAIAELMEGALQHFDGERYRLLAWCVMPNHVHVLIETVEGHPLGDLLHSWKSFVATKANQLLGRSGSFWQREYMERYVRNAEHLQAVIHYIEENPTNAGLVRLKTEWLWSSARIRSALGAQSGVPTSSRPDAEMSNER